MFLVTPLPQLHLFLHLPEVLGFKSGSFLAFLTTNYLEVNFLRLPEIFREYSCFSGFKILFLMSLFLFLFNFLKLFVPLCIDYPIIFNGISEGNEYQGMCLPSHLSRTNFYKDFRCPPCFPSVLTKRTASVIKTFVAFSLLEMILK